MRKEEEGTRGDGSTADASPAGSTASSAGACQGQASRSDICRDAREHYEQASNAACSWSSSIGHAIAAYEREPELIQQRDALLAALKDVTRHLMSQRDYELGNGHPEEYAAVERADAAIAQAEATR